MPVFEVRTARGVCPVTVERGAVERIAGHLPRGHSKVFIVSERQVWQAQSQSMQRVEGDVLFLPGGEENKRLAPLEALAGEMVNAGADRSSVIIAFGGGIVTDMAGFLAAVFLRGVSLIQVPTTLLAQVDAAVGGKTGVNLAGGKNLIGSFYQPAAVLIDPSLLRTLPDREYRAGLYEVIKSGVIANVSLFELLRDRKEAVLAREEAVVDRLIAACVEIKAEIVSSDERESGRRRILNFGHTIGHAIEAETGYTRFLHGEAVAMGMKGAVYLALSAGYIGASDAAAILGLIEQYGPLPSGEGISPESVFARLTNDKKTVHGTVHFIFPTGIGTTEVVTNLDPDAVQAAIAQALA